MAHSFLGKISPFREIGFGTYLYRNSFHLSGDPFWGGSRHSVKSDSVHICTETVFIFQEILRAKSDFGASMQFDRRPMALPYPYGRRLEVAHRVCVMERWTDLYRIV
jgi:hypothetical protein